MTIELIANGVVLPSPVSMSANDELLWTSDTGRTLSGEMVGSVITTKNTYSIQWSWITSDQMQLINDVIHNAGFFPLQIQALGVDSTVYRGAITKNIRNIGADVYYESVSVDFIER